MSTVAEIHPGREWVERWSDWLNPLLIKETRQALNSRHFVITFLLMLVSCWLILVTKTLRAGESLEFEDLGRDLFFLFTQVLAVPVLIVVPFLSFRSLIGERENSTFEMLSITTLHPQQILWGKLLTAGLQVLIYFSTVTPFMAFTYLLKGIDIISILYTLVLLAWYSLALSLLALTISSCMLAQHIQSLGTVGCIVGLLVVFWIFRWSAAMRIYELGTLAPGTMLLMLATEGIASLLLGHLLFRTAEVQLTFEADNRSTGLRLALSLLVLCGLGGGAGIVLLDELLGHAIGFSPDLFRSLEWWLWALLSIYGLFFVTEPDEVSRRLQRQLREIPEWKRLLLPLYWPGGGRGLLFVASHLLLTLLGCTLLEDWLLASRISPLRPLWPLFLYTVFYLGLAAIIGRIGPNISSQFRPLHARVTVVIVFALGCILPEILSLFNSEFHRNVADRSHWGIVWLLNPFQAVEMIPRGTGGLALVALVLLMLIGNVRTVLKGVKDIWVAAPPSATRPTVLPSG